MSELVPLVSGFNSVVARPSFTTIEHDPALAPPVPNCAPKVRCLLAAAHPSNERLAAASTTPQPATRTPESARPGPSFRGGSTSSVRLTIAATYNNTV